GGWGDCGEDEGLQNRLALGVAAAHGAYSAYSSMGDRRRAVPMMRTPRSRFTLPTFDALANLAQRDPSALERLRVRLTDEIIRRAPNDAARRRLEGLKFRIDMERRRAPDALAACVRISALMHSSLADLHQAF